MVRRKFIKGLVGGAGLLSGLLTFGRPVFAGNIGIENSLCALYSKRNSAANIGKIYLENNPEEYDRNLLVANILKGWSKQKFSNLVNNRLLMKSGIKSQIQTDFIMDRIAEIDGWVLSWTEVRIFALIHISDTRALSVVDAKLNEPMTGSNPHV